MTSEVGKKLAEQFSRGERLSVWRQIENEPNLPLRIHRALEIYGYLRINFDAHGPSLAFQFHQMCYFQSKEPSTLSDTPRTDSAPLSLPEPRIPENGGR